LKLRKLQSALRVNEGAGASFVLRHPADIDFARCVVKLAEPRKRGTDDLRHRISSRTPPPARRSRLRGNTVVIR